MLVTNDMLFSLTLVCCFFALLKAPLNKSLAYPHNFTVVAPMISLVCPPSLEFDSYFPG